MKIHTVSACCRNNGIGWKGTLPWDLPSEFAYFVRLSVGNPPEGKQNVVIMGRKTWNSKPHARLSRINVVLTKSDKQVGTPDKKPDIVAHSLEEVVKTLQGDMWKDKIHDVFAIGGGSIYKLIHDSPYCGTVYLTRIDVDIKCDAFHPTMDDRFQLLPTEQFPEVPQGEQEENGMRWKVEIYQKKN